MLATRPQGGCHALAHGDSPTAAPCRRWYVTLPYDCPRPLRSLSHRLSPRRRRSEEHTSELQSQSNLVCRLLLEKKNRPDLTSHLSPGFGAKPSTITLVSYSRCPTACGDSVPSFNRPRPQRRW